MAMNIASALLAEHGVFYAQFDYLERTLPTASLEEIKLLGGMLQSALEGHADLEDDVLIAAVEERVGKEGVTAAMRDEHNEIRQLVSRLPYAKTADEAREILLNIIEMARSHFAKEEEALFPLAEQVLPADESRRLADKWAEHRRVRIEA